MSDKPKVILVVGGAGLIPGLSLEWLDAVRENARVTEVHYDVESYSEGSIFTTEQLKAAERLVRRHFSSSEIIELKTPGILPQLQVDPGRQGRGCDHPSQVRHFKRKKGRS